MYKKKFSSQWIIFDTIVCFPGPVAAYKTCWVFGDDFASRSFDQHFKLRKSTELNSYMKNHFDISGYFNNVSAENPSVIGRFASLMTNAMHREYPNNGKTLASPKIVVVVPEENILRTFGENGGTTTTYSSLKLYYDCIR